MKIFNFAKDSNVFFRKIGESKKLATIITDFSLYFGSTRNTDVSRNF